MADSTEASARGHDVEFVEPPPKEFECPICMLVLRDPHLTSCCGYLFCATCINRIKKQKKRCPLCNEEFTTFLDKGRQRRVNELMVKCTEEQHGCKWTGQLGKLNKHLSPEELEGECHYVKVPCPNRCSRMVQRSQLQIHLENQCDTRRYVCDQCGLESTYKKIMRDHGAMCRMSEQECPNGCKIVNLRRGLLDEHLSICPEQEIPCQFANVGCHVSVKRKHLSEHVEGSVSQHLDCLMTAHSVALQRIKQLEDHNKNLVSQRELSDQKLIHLELQIQQLQSILEQQLHVDMQNLKLQEPNDLKNALPVQPTDGLHSSRNEEWYRYIISNSTGENESSNDLIMPIIVRFDHFLDHLQSADSKWFSVPFFTHNEGYKMCLRVMANGNGDGRGSGQGTHISAHFYLMQGEYDESLVWPYTGKLVIEILNQLDDRHHYRREVVIDDSATMKVRVRVRDRQRAAQGRGKSELIAHRDIHYNAAKNLQYLVDGTVYFRLSVLDY